MTILSKKTLSSILKQFQTILENDGLDSEQASFVIGQIFAEATQKVKENQEKTNDSMHEEETVQQICQYIEKKMKEYANS